MQATVFTHLSIDPDFAIKTKDANYAHELKEKVKDSFKAYIQTPSIGLVYVYVDIGLKLTLEQLGRRRRLEERAEAGDQQPEIWFSLNELEAEDRVRNILKKTVDDCVHELQLKDRDYRVGTTRHKFEFVGLPHLLSLFNALYRVDPQLIEDLAGHASDSMTHEQPIFTYDSAKFVEAIVRLRGSSPVLRFDADVEVCETSTRALLDQIKTLETDDYPFFSGRYCGRTEPDLLNDFGIRLHWFVRNPLEEGHRSQDPPVQQFDGHPNSFLSDLGEIGATQLPNGHPAHSLSAECTKLKEARGFSANRDSGQVISGAGLYMSPSCIQVLPPVMNLQNFTMWVDDHLKRRLHEALGHIPRSAPERVESAGFRQDRHPQGVFKRDIEWARSDYIERVFRGCIWHAFIMEPDQEPGPLALLIRPVVERMQAPAVEGACGKLFEKATKTADQILQLWRVQGYGSPILSDWCERLKSPLASARYSSEFERICKTSAQDAVTYLQLVHKWQRYVQMINKLTSRHAYWLFRPPVDQSSGGDSSRSPGLA